MKDRTPKTALLNFKPTFLDFLARFDISSLSPKERREFNEILSHLAGKETIIPASTKDKIRTSKVQMKQFIRGLLFAYPSLRPENMDEFEHCFEQTFNDQIKANPRTPHK